MSNNYFLFKQFKIIHGQTAMKVGTDGVLLGAWADVRNIQSVLDIGTGTGLIAMMIAQRTEKATIDALEIEKDAYDQAKMNINDCKWNNRISVFHESFQQYSKRVNKKYDLIISNPPYFTDVTHSPDNRRTEARHSKSLSFSDIVEGTLMLLGPMGRLCIILPVDEAKSFREIAKISYLFCNKTTFVKPTLAKDPKRVLMEYSFANITENIEDQLVIEKEKRHDYTNEYKDLTKDFYLNF